MEQLQKSLQNYFRHLEKHTLLWQEINKKAKRPVTALQNESEQLRLVLRVQEEGVELLKLPNLKSRLVDKIKVALEAEISLLMALLEEFSSANRELKSRLTAVEKTCNHLNDRSELHQGSATQPSTMQMLEWAEDAWKYYHTLYLQTNGAFSLLDYESEDSVKALVKALREEKELFKHIQRILAHTQYFVQDVHQL